MPARMKNATAPTAVPSARIVARPSDCPVDNTLAVATVSAAQNGFSQPICMAIQ